MLRYSIIPRLRCTLVCFFNTPWVLIELVVRTPTMKLYVVHFRILFFSSFSLASSGGQILSKNRACKTWCYMYIPREVAPTTRLARLRKNGCTEFFLIWMIACNVHLSSMVRFWRNSDGLNFFLCGQTWRGGRRGGGCGGRGGRGPPPPAKPTVLHSIRNVNDCSLYALIYGPPPLNK